MNFITKDSGVREEYSTGMKRDTQSGKPRFDLLIPEGIPYERQILTRIAELMTRGAEKYGLRNWELAHTKEEYDRFRASAFRHFMQRFCGEEDEDHLSAIFFNTQAAEVVKEKLLNSNSNEGMN